MRNTGQENQDDKFFFFSGEFTIKIRRLSCEGNAKMRKGDYY